MNIYERLPSRINLIQNTRLLSPNKRLPEEICLEELFFLINKFKSENNERIFIFDSYNSFCEKEKKFCKVHDINKGLIYYRDRTHILPEIKQFIIPKFNDFFDSINK